MPAPRCPICHRPVPPRTEKSAFPFCSPRCKMVDLGKWLDEQYRVPVTEDSEEDGAPAASPQNRPPPEDMPEHTHKEKA